MKAYRLKRSEPSIIKFIKEYAKERGVECERFKPSNEFPYWTIHSSYNGYGMILGSTNIGFKAEDVGIDEFMKQIERLAIPKFKLGNSSASFTPEGDGIHIGNITVKHSDMKELINWYNQHNERD
jgi:hypothetical protein